MDDRAQSPLDGAEGSAFADQASTPMSGRCWGGGGSRLWVPKRLGVCTAAPNKPNSARPRPGNPSLFLTRSGMRSSKFEKVQRPDDPDDHPLVGSGSCQGPRAKRAKQTQFRCRGLRRGVRPTAPNKANFRVFGLKRKIGLKDKANLARLSPARGHPKAGSTKSEARDPKPEMTTALSRQTKPISPLVCLSLPKGHPGRTPYGVTTNAPNKANWRRQDGA